MIVKEPTQAPPSIKDPEVLTLLANARKNPEASHQSPTAWEDQLLYFLLPDRFSNGEENGYLDIDGNNVDGRTAPFTPADTSDAVSNEQDAASWRDAGGKYVGGTLKGLTSKLGYLKRLGVTAVWIGPIFRQVPGDESLYHGYACQDFLEVEPRLGTRQDLKDLVQTAHSHGIYVILDIILNHSGDVFGYVGGQEPNWTGQKYPVQGFRDSTGKPTLPFQKLDSENPPEKPQDCAIWPSELQDPNAFTCEGQINNWDNYPEYLQGDFFTLKDINIGPFEPDGFVPTPALKALCEVYKYWIAYADIDGFRIDTVKHMGYGPSRYFATTIHEFAVSIGKMNYLLVGEITGGSALETVETTGLDAALGIGNIQAHLWNVPKGLSDPSNYFDLFRNASYLRKGTHAWLKDKVVTMIDDHDQVWRGGQDKQRFCASGNGTELLFPALALNLCTLGIPCIYYGTEQAFDGQGGSDRYIREAMFGGAFGAFRSREKHFFNEKTQVFQQISRLATLRQQYLTFRRGRQYLREISGDGAHFGLPTRIGGSKMNSVVAWSRIFADEEMLCAINTDAENPVSAWVTIDQDLHAAGDELSCLFSSDGKEGLAGKLRVEARNGRAVYLTVPKAGFVVFS